MRIQHNIMAMNAYRNYTANTSAVAKNLEKLSSGYKINRAGDDAAGLAISEKMRAQITGLKTAQKNVKDGISLVKTAEGATQEIHDMLNRMVDLATQSANGTYQDEVDREAITNEFEQLKSEINRIADSSNFNGIKLLDGSLDSKSATGTVKVAGMGISGGAMSRSLATKGVYESSAAAAATGANLTVGDSFQYNVGLDDGRSITANLTLKDMSSDGKTLTFEGDSGETYTVTTATAKKATGAEMKDAVLQELQKSDLAKDFKVEAAATDGTYKLTNLKEGDSEPKVLSFDYRWTVAGKQNATPGTALGVKSTGTLGEGVELDRTKITEYNGKNYDDAVFTINGHKFVLLTETHDGSVLNDPTLTDNTEAMHAALGLGADVTILVGGQAGLQNTNANFNQNIKAIADVTGLTVTDAVDETAYGAAATSGVSSGGGIRLSVGAGGSKGLTLQIGDTSDSYNQLKVSIGDMHTKALGIDRLDLGTQTGAQAAVTSIKDAINKVSQVRGTLGATQNRLEHTQNNLSVMQENIQDAESTIRDTDIAEEMMAYTKNNILVQSAQAMLAQANQVPQGVLQLLG